MPNDLAIHRIPTTETPIESLKPDQKPARAPSIKGTEIIYGTNETTARRTSQKSCNFNGKIIVDVVRSAIIRSRR